MLGDELVGARRYPREQVGAHRQVQHRVGRVGVGEGHVQAVDPRHDLARLARQLAARGSEEHLVAAPLEQHDAELALERLYGMRDVLPAGKAALCRLRVAGMLRRGEHMAELVDLHAYYPLTLRVPRRLPKPLRHRPVEPLRTATLAPSAPEACRTGLWLPAIRL